jgi:hypothetical protein
MHVELCKCGCCICLADLSPFKHITPCGISDRPVGSVKTALGLEQQQQQQQQQQQEPLAGGGSGSSSNSNSSSAASILQQQLEAVVHDPLIVEYRYALLESLEEVFGLTLQPASQEQLQQLLQQRSNSSSSSSSSRDSEQVALSSR